MLVVVELKSAAVELVGSGLGHQGDRRRARHPLFGVRRTGGDVDHLDVLFRRHVSHVVRQPHVHAGGAVNAGNVGLGVATVDVRGEGAARCIRDRVLQRRRQCAGHQVDQRLIIAIPADGHVGDGRAGDLRVGIGLVGLQCDRAGLNRHLVGDLADFELGIDTLNGIRRDIDALCEERPEAGGGHRYVVVAGKHVDERIASAVIGLIRAADADLFAGECDGGAGNHGSRRIRNGSDYRPI